ncbi:helix-turn-helix domain-containing protein [Amycolatopsis sp. H20-H5]|uniref:helix-turn-helix domain-containing protein n=1 Tax=Amycolatopsis sp. H20-H5 TaxID=3046309 RepID=UPI002DB876D6|nr:helix-turn-helix transcriptional regulator [Amycolatopsis sp. H20-H5]MEC3974654.1 helix-turn-helix transcriptional regulator [Amycolatopsis sp. H20-H5]
MPAKPSDARRRDLGAELRRRREIAGLNGLELARKTGWAQSTISRLEWGQGAVSELLVMTYLAHCGVSARDAAEVLSLARETEDGYLVRRDVLRTLVLHETTTLSITAVAPLLVPGLLQTEDYARAVIGLAGIVEEAEVEPRVSVRMGRQELLRRWQPPEFTYFLYEAALRCVIGGIRVMNEQMLHLAFLAGRPQISLRIVPFEVGRIAASAGGMTLMDFADHGPVLYVESQFAGMFVERAEDIKLGRTILRDLGDVALDEGQSRELLVQLASDYDQPTKEPTDAGVAEKQVQQRE